jgi:hypothetical protein
MTPAAAVLFVFVTHGAGRGPIDDVVAASARALPPGARTIVQTTPAAPADPELIAAAVGAGAAAAVVVSWTDPALPSAQIRAVVGLPAHPRWAARTVAFSAADQLGERERALGLVIASIVEDAFEARPPDAASAAPVVRVAPAIPARPAAAPPSEAPAPAPPPAAAPAREPEHPGRWALEVDVTTGFESGTDLDDMIGGSIGLRRFLDGSLALRAGIVFQVTAHDYPDITTQTRGGSLGLGWSTGLFGRPARLRGGVRADLMVLYQSVHVSPADGATITDRSYWTAAGDLLVELTLGLSRGTSLLLAGGLEEKSTRADLEIAGQDAATLPRTGARIELGVLSRF